MTAPTIEFTVRVREGGATRFESSVNAPLMGGKEQQDRVAEQWLALMAAGLAMARALRGEGDD